MRSKTMEMCIVACSSKLVGPPGKFVIHIKNNAKNYTIARPLENFRIILHGICSQVNLSENLFANGYSSYHNSYFL